jgi:hypothetical protein
LPRSILNARHRKPSIYDAYRSSGLALEEFEGTRYHRIGYIEKLIAEGILGTNLRHSVKSEQLAV